VNSWVLNTALSRLDSQNDGVVIVTMQRLHEFDLSGMLMERGWRCLTMPQIAMEPASYALGPNEVHERPEGEPLQPKRDDPEALKSHRLLIGSRLWSAQYQQQPLPTEGNIIKTSWMPRYEFSPGERRFRRTVLSCDPAGKPGDHNDYTAITVFGFDTKPVHLLNANRGHWSVLQMLRQITTLAREWNVGVVLVEDTASGMGLIQLLREQSNLQVIGCRPDVNKEMRMSRHEGRFESGQVVLPKEAPWLAELETELFGFPHARHDDYVDSILQFLDWYSKRWVNRPPEYLGLPIVG
jgi:predicted phage terminase large subunit-like protein